MHEDHDLSLKRDARLLSTAALAALLLMHGRAAADVRSARSDVVVVRAPLVADMDSGPLWVSVATWDPPEEHVVIADPGSGRLYVYDTRGRILRRVVNPGRGDLEFAKPIYASLIGARYLIATSSNRWLWFDQNLDAKTAWELDWEKGEGKYSQLHIAEFDFSDTHLHGIGMTMSFNGEWSGKGVFAVSLKERAVERTADLGKDADEISYYREPPFNLSVCAGTAWLLQMAPDVSIVEARDGGKRLKSFPQEFRKRPAIPLLVNADSVRARRAAQRNAPVAEGLFCADDRLLLLLAHRPRAGGGLQWLVYPIDPSQDTIAKAIELPTIAAEIVFVPGRKRWAILEKGQMKYPLVQPMSRIISFPRPALTTQETGRAR